MKILCVCMCVCMYVYVCGCLYYFLRKKGHICHAAAIFDHCYKETWCCFFKETLFDKETWPMSLLKDYRSSGSGSGIKRKATVFLM